MPWLEQLLGKDEVVQPAEGSRRGWNNWGGYETRGVYNVLPASAATTDSSPASRAAAQRESMLSGVGGAHVDPQPSHMVCACYIDEVPEGGGGFCIFPGIPTPTEIVDSYLISIEIFKLIFAGAGSHNEFYVRDTGFADMGGSSFLYTDPERARSHCATEADIPFVSPAAICLHGPLSPGVEGPVLNF
jgi:hypothetical protein